MKNKLAKFFKKPVVLNNSQKVELAHQKIATSLSMFSKINEDIEETNATLQSVIEEETQRVKEIERNRERALDELNMNKALQERLSQFIVNKGEKL